MIRDDDPLLKPVPPRGTRLGAVDETAKAEVDAREAVGEEELAAAAAMTGAANAKGLVKAETADGKRGVLRISAPERETPDFGRDYEPKAPPPDEPDAYSAEDGAAAAAK